MAAMATQTDVEAELGRALTSDEQAKVDAALNSASDYVRTETQRKWEAGTYTVTRHVRGGKVALDSPMSVSSVVSVDPLGNATDLTGWILRGSTVYGLGSTCDVEVTYTSDGVVPDELRRVVAAMAARDLTDERPAAAASFTQTAGPFSSSATYGAEAEAVLPTPSERRILRKYGGGRPRVVSLI